MPSPSTAKGVIHWAAPLYLSLLAGFILGCEVAWLLMKFTWLDMRFPGEAAIPVGLALGLAGGLWALRRPPRLLVVRRLPWLLLAGALPLFYAVATAPKAFWYTAPVMVRHGFGLSPLAPLTFWSLVAVALLLGAGLHWRRLRLKRL